MEWRRGWVVERWVASVGGMKQRVGVGIGGGKQMADGGGESRR
jgi:hypothetical protein